MLKRARPPDIFLESAMFYFSPFLIESFGGSDRNFPSPCCQKIALRSCLDLPTVSSISCFVRLSIGTEPEEKIERALERLKGTHWRSIRSSGVAESARCRGHRAVRCSANGALELAVTCKVNVKNVRIVMVGDVDAGKSRILGRLLVDLDLVTPAKLEELNVQQQTRRADRVLVPARRLSARARSSDYPRSHAYLGAHGGG